LGSPKKFESVSLQDGKKACDSTTSLSLMTFSQPLLSPINSYPDKGKGLYTNPNRSYPDQYNIANLPLLNQT
jgi:hypothetical protein